MVGRDRCKFFLTFSQGGGIRNWHMVDVAPRVFRIFCDDGDGGDYLALPLQPIFRSSQNHPSSHPPPGGLFTQISQILSRQVAMQYMLIILNVLFIIHPQGYEYLLCPNSHISIFCFLKNCIEITDTNINPSKQVSTIDESSILFRFITIILFYPLDLSQQLRYLPDFCLPCVPILLAMHS